MRASIRAALLIFAGLAPATFGQVPTVPTAPTAPPTTPAAEQAAAGEAAGQVGGLLGLCQALDAKCKECREKLCATPLGQMADQGLRQASVLSGGIIQPLCPTVPKAEDIAALEKANGPNDPGVVAAKVKADEADAKRRVAALDYLASVDCRHWPDAQKALLEGLRADRNECVRFAAARALARGCCCSREAIDALTLVIKCSDTDGNPPESSQRVRSMAWVALQRCQSCVREPAPVPERPEAPDPPVRPEAPPAAEATTTAIRSTAPPRPVAVVAATPRAFPRRDPAFRPAAHAVVSSDPAIPRPPRTAVEALARAWKRPRSTP